MYSNISDNVNFSFEIDRLGQKLGEMSSQSRTGYWKIKLDSQPELWYLTLVQGRVLFSGLEPLSWQAYRHSLCRNVLPFRHETVQKSVDSIETQLTTMGKIQQVGLILSNIENKGLIKREQVRQASQQNILSDFDRYLFESMGKAEFISEPGIITQAQIPGFKLQDLITRASQRRIHWKGIKAQIPSMKAIPSLNQTTLEYSQLTNDQQQRISKLIESGKTLEDIATNLGKDPLEIGQFFAKAVKTGLISLQLPPDEEFNQEKKQIFIVDDSPILLQQFHRLVTKWGYKVQTCSNPFQALTIMISLKPHIVFLDINMPGMSGFELIKEIRRISELSSIPLVLLTAEKSVSNQWRAHWANCQFLTKPRSKEEIEDFRKNLQQILQETLPLG